MKSFALKITIVLILFISFTSCGSEVKEVTEPYNVLVYFDLTESVDSTTIALAVIKLEKIIKSLPPASKFAVRIIYNNPLEENSYEFETKKLNPGDEFITSRKVAYLNDLRNNSVKCKNIMLQKFYELRTQNNNSPKMSCIINTLKSAHDYFQNTTGYINALFYLSDMIEQCDARYSATGSVYMKAPTRPSLSKLESSIETHFKPQFNLFDKVKGNIFFVLTTDKQGDATCLRTDEVQLLWAQILKKVGYPADVHQKMHCKVDLPQSFSSLYNFDN